MIFGVVLRNSDSKKRWAEWCDWPNIQTTEMARKRAEDMVANYNSTRIGPEKKRTLVGLSVLPPKESKEHDWRKTNLVTIGGFGNTAAHDSYRCSICGVTGKRFGLSPNIIRDRKFKNDKYSDCSKSRQLREDK